MKLKNSTKLTGITSIDDITELNWDVELHRVETSGEGLWAKNWNAVVREDTREVIGMVGQRYEPLQNRDAFAPLQSLLNSGVCTLDSMGTFKGGADVWVMAKLDSAITEVIPGDEVENYILLTNNHAGSRSARYGFCGIRPACDNILAALLRDYTARHTQSVHAKMANLARQVNEQIESFRQRAEQYRRLARKPINSAQLDDYVCEVFKVSMPGSQGGRTPAVVNKVQELFETGRGMDIPGVRGTWWGAYNAVTEYLTHEKGRSDETRLSNLLVGSAGRTTEKALMVALEASEQPAGHIFTFGN